MENHENSTDRPKAHRVYSVMRNLGVALLPTLVATGVEMIVPWMHLVDIIALLAVAIGVVWPYRSNEPFSPVRKACAGWLGAFAMIEVAICIFQTGCFGCIHDLRFASAVGDADRVVIRDGGFFHGDPDREPELYVLTNKAEIAAFNQMFRFTGSRLPCKCCGYPGVDWWKGDRRIVKSAIHHGIALRCEGFSGDLGIALSSRAQLRDWFKRHCDIDLSKANGPRWMSQTSQGEK